MAAQHGRTLTCNLPLLAEQTATFTMEHQEVADIIQTILNENELDDKVARQLLLIRKDAT